MTTKEDITNEIIGLRSKGLSFQEIADSLRQRNILDITKQTVSKYYKEYVKELQQNPRTDLATSAPFIPSNQSNDEAKVETSNPEHENVHIQTQDGKTPGPVTNLGQSAQETSRPSYRNENWQERDYRKQQERMMNEERQKNFHGVIGSAVLFTLLLVFMVLYLLWSNGDYGVFVGLSHAYHQIARWFTVHQDVIVLLPGIS